MTRRRPRFNGAPADHAPTELLASIKPAATKPPAPWRPPGERFADPRTWRGENDIGLMSGGVMVIEVAGPAPLASYRPEPASFPALPPAIEPRDVLPPVPATEPAVIGDDLKLPVIWCEMPGCIGFFLHEEAAGFRDARDRAHAAGWRTDALGRLACPDCQQGRADYRTPQPVSMQHPGVPRRWHEHGTLPSAETQDRLEAEAAYARRVRREHPDWARAMASAAQRTAAS